MLGVEKPENGPEVGAVVEGWVFWEPVCPELRFPPDELLLKLKLNLVDVLFAPPANALPKTEEFALGVVVVPKMFDVVGGFVPGPAMAPPCFEASEVLAGRPKENGEVFEGSVILGSACTC